MSEDRKHPYREWYCKRCRKKTWHSPIKQGEGEAWWREVGGVKGYYRKRYCEEPYSSGTCNNSLGTIEVTMDDFQALVEERDRLQKVEDKYNALVDKCKALVAALARKQEAEQEIARLVAGDAPNPAT